MRESFTLKNKKFNRKCVCVISIVFLFICIAIFYYSFHIHNENLENANESLEYSELQLDNIATIIDKLKAENDAFLRSGLTLGEIEDAIEKLAKVEIDFNFKDSRIEKRIEAIKIQKKALEEELYFIQSKFKIQNEINALFTGIIIAIDGETINTEASVSSNLDAKHVAQVREAVYIKPFAGVELDEWQLAINTLIDEADSQVKQIDTANALVYVLSKKIDAEEDISEIEYNQAKIAIEQIKNETVQTRLNTKLGKVLTYMADVKVDEMPTPTADGDNSSNDSDNNSEFVNIKDVDSSIIVDLRYASTNNFTGECIYSFTQAILRTSTAQKLEEANKILNEQGYTLKIWDAYRPLSAQYTLWDAYPDPNYVAYPDPNKIRGHQLGATVDVTLSTLDGVELAMQSDFDDFSLRAHRDYNRNSQQEEYYQILNNAMEQVGFTGYLKEWWHYSDTNQDFHAVQVDPNLY